MDALAIGLQLCICCSDTAHEIAYQCGQLSSAR